MRFMYYIRIVGIINGVKQSHNSNYQKDTLHSKIIYMMNRFERDISYLSPDEKGGRDGLRNNLFHAFDVYNSGGEFALLRPAVHRGLDALAQAHSQSIDNPYAQSATIVDYFNNLINGHDEYPGLQKWIYHPSDISNNGTRITLGEKTIQLRARVENYYTSLSRWLSGNGLRIADLFNVRMAIEAKSRKEGLSFIELEKDNLHKYLKLVGSSIRDYVHIRSKLPLIRDVIQIDTNEMVEISMNMLETPIVLSKSTNIHLPETPLVFKVLPEILRRNHNRNNQNEKSDCYANLGSLSMTVSLEDIESIIRPPLTKEFIPAISSVIYLQLEPQDLENSDSFKNALHRNRYQVDLFMWYLGIWASKIGNIEESRYLALAKKLNQLINLPIEQGKLLYRQLIPQLGFDLSRVLSE